MLGIKTAVSFNLTIPTKDPKYFSRLYGQSGFLKDLALDRLVGLSPGSIAPAGKLHPLPDAFSCSRSRPSESRIAVATLGSSSKA